MLVCAFRQRSLAVTWMYGACRLTPEREDHGSQQPKLSAWRRAGPSIQPAEPATCSASQPAHTNRDEEPVKALCQISNTTKQTVQCEYDIKHTITCSCHLFSYSSTKKRDFLAYYTPTCFSGSQNTFCMCILLLWLVNNWGHSVIRSG